MSALSKRLSVDPLAKNVRLLVKTEATVCQIFSPLFSQNQCRSNEPLMSAMERELSAHYRFNSI